MGLTLKPLPRLLDQMAERGNSWPEAVQDLMAPRSVAEDTFHPGRFRIYGEKFVANVVPKGDHLLVIGICRRTDTRETPKAEQVVGKETKAPVRKSRGGSGSKWPTSVKEIVRRIEAAGDPWSVERSPSTQHWLVLRSGRRVATVPFNPREFRALLNSCQQIRRAGLDLRRTG